MLKATIGQEASPLSVPSESLTSLPRISVVTPSFNQGAYIGETIRSVIDQGYSNIEYIIMDGGSNDSTLDVIRRFSDKITYWESKPDKGQSDAINKGLRKATGEVFNWLNSDDYYSDGALLAVADAFMKHSADVVCGREIRFGEGIDSYESPGSTIFKDLEETLFFAHNVQPCTFFRKKFYDEFGGLSESLHYLMDSDFFARYLAAYGQERIVKIDKIVSNFRLHPSSKTVSLRKKFENDRWSIRLQLLKDLRLRRIFDPSRPLGVTLVPVKPYDIRQKIRKGEFYYHYVKNFLYKCPKENRRQASFMMLLELAINPSFVRLKTVKLLLRSLLK